MRFLTKLAIALVGWNFLPPADAPAAQIVPEGRTFQCTPTAVWDGDGPIWCAEGPKVRIAGVAAREMDGSCRSDQPCPPVGAEDARDRLVRVLGGARGVLPTGHIVVHSATMTCLSDGSAGGSRTARGAARPCSAISLARSFGRAGRSAGRATGGIIDVEQEGQGAKGCGT